MQQLLDQISLARRWKLSPRTLERWRWLELGPPFLKVGGRVLYRIEDIEAFELACRRNSGASKVNPQITNARHRGGPQQLEGVSR